MQHERIPNSNHSETWNNLDSDQPEKTQEISNNLGQSVINAIETQDAITSPEAKSKMVNDSIKAAEDRLDHMNNAFTTQNNELWYQLKNEGLQPNNTSEYRDLKNHNQEALNEAVDQAYQNLIDELSPHMNERELGKLCGEATTTSGFINHKSAFHHFSKEGKIGLMETFNFYDYSQIFKEKGVDIYDQIEKQIFNGKLEDTNDMSWDIRAGSIANKDKEPIECIYVGQSFREDEYDQDGQWSGEQWFSGNGGIYIDLNDFSNIRLNGRCSKEQKEMFEIAKNTTAKNIFDLIDGGIETLVE